MTAVTPGREEPLAEIVERLRINWNNHSERIGEPLMRLINCLSSCEDVNLSGIDRDLIVYALAFARLVAKPAEEGWRSMETAPKEGIFLAKMHDGREPPNPYYEIIGWNSHGGDKGAWMNDGGSEYHEKAEAMGYCRPLSWMPLPSLSTTGEPKP